MEHRLYERGRERGEWGSFQFMEGLVCPGGKIGFYFEREGTFKGTENSSEVIIFAFDNLIENGLKG